MPAETWQHHSPWFLIVAFVLATLAVGRVARILTHDDFPPAIAWRVWWTNRTGRWGSLAECPWCMAPWLALADLGWAWWSGLNWHQPWGAAWLLANLWFALGYAAAIVVAYDEPE
jgi:hypothetical protein